MPRLGVATEGLVGSPEIYNLLVGELDAVYRLAYHLTSSRDVEDLVQETFLRAFKAADQFKLAEYGPRPWLFKILHNLISSHFTAKQRETHHLGKLVHDLPMAAQPPHSPAPHATRGEPAWDGVDERLKKALDSLQMPARLTFLLFAVEGLKYREIAEITEVPLGTVMSRLCRAREELARHLGDYAKEQGWHNADRQLADRQLADRQLTLIDDQGETGGRAGNLTNDQTHKD